MFVRAQSTGRAKASKRQGMTGSTITCKVRHGLNAFASSIDTCIAARHYEMKSFLRSLSTSALLPASMKSDTASVIS